MKLKAKLYFGSAAFAAALVSAPFSGAQQTAPIPLTSFSYDLSRETTLQGTVVAFSASSEAAPLGPHATIQTSSGVVEVHLGSASFMKQNDIFLAPGDSVAIVGETTNIGTAPVFLARVLRKGSQTVTLRNLKGIPLEAKPASAGKSRSILGGAR